MRYRRTLRIRRSKEYYLVKKGGELILKIENMTRRILLPDLISNKEIESAKYEAGSLELRFVQP